MLAQAWIPVFWFALWVMSPDFRVLMNLMVLALAGYMFLPLPLLSCFVVPALVYIPVHSWFSVLFKRRHILIFLALCALSLGLRELTGWSPPFYCALEEFVTDAVLDPFDTLVVPFVESFNDGLWAIDFYNQIEADKKLIADYATDLFYSPLDPDSGFLTIFRSIGYFFAFVARCDDTFFRTLQMIVDGGCKLASSRFVLLVVGCVGLLWLAVFLTLR